MNSTLTNPSPLDSQANKTNKSSLNPLLIALSLLLIIFVGLIAFAVYANSEDSDKEDTEDTSTSNDDNSDDQDDNDSGLTLNEVKSGVPSEQSDPFTISKVELQGSKLYLKTSFTGGCEDHVFTLYFNNLGNNFADLSIVHDANGDTCESFVTDKPLDFFLGEFIPANTTEMSIVLTDFEGNTYPFTYTTNNQLSYSNAITSDVITTLTGSSQYIGDNQWEYRIIGSVPSVCHEYETQVIVAESFPEQVSLSMKVFEPDPNQACILLFEELNITGTYSASENASFNFTVESIPFAAQSPMVEE